MSSTGATAKNRKKRAVINHQDVVDWCVLHPQADSHQVSVYFGITKRAAQQHLKRIRKAVD